MAVSTDRLTHQLRQPNSAAAINGQVQNWRRRNRPEAERLAEPVKPRAEAPVCDLRGVSSAATGLEESASRARTPPERFDAWPAPLRGRSWVWTSCEKPVSSSSRRWHVVQPEIW